MRSERALAEPRAARDRLVPGVRVRRDLRDRRAAPLAACLPAARRRPSARRHISGGMGRSRDALLWAADLPQRRSVLGYRIVCGQIATGRSPATVRPTWARQDPATDPGHPDSHGSNGCSPTAEARSARTRGPAVRRILSFHPTIARRSHSGAQALVGGNRRTCRLGGGARLPRTVTRFPRCDRGAVRCECGAPVVGESRMCRLSVATRTPCVRTRTVWWRAWAEWDPAPGSSISRPRRHVRRRTSASRPRCHVQRRTSSPVRTTAVARIAVRRHAACGRRSPCGALPAAPRNSARRMSAAARYCTSARGEMALRATVGAPGTDCGRVAYRMQSPPWRTPAEHRITAPRQRDADQVTAGLFRAARWHPLWRAPVVWRAVDRRHLAAGRLGGPARSQGTDSLISAGRWPFVRRRPTAVPTSCRRQLTIRWRSAMNEWTLDDSFTAGARGFLCRAFAEPVVRRELATRSMRFDRCAEASVRMRALAALMFRVTNVIAPSARCVEWRTCARSRPMPGPGRSARTRSGADWRSPVRWRTVAE